MSAKLNRRDHNLLQSYQARQSAPTRRAVEKVNVTHKAIIEAGGGVYVPGMFGNLVLFNSPATGSTLALPEEQLTTKAVRQHIEESNTKFGVK